LASSWPVGPFIERWVIADEKLKELLGVERFQAGLSLFAHNDGYTAPSRRRRL